MNQNFHSEEELYADQFAAYYAETEDIYGDDIESAYADFEAFAAEDEGSEDEYSEMDELFEEFYSENADIYGDNVEEAYADFTEIVEEDEYATGAQKAAHVLGRTADGAIGGAILTQIGTSFGESAKRRRFLKKKREVGSITKAENEELKGLIKSRTKAKLIGAGAGAALGAGGAGLNIMHHNAIAKNSNNSAEDLFEDFYSANIDLYEDNVEEAYADFEDIMEDIYAEEAKASVGERMKAFGKKNFQKQDGVSALIGTGVGAVGGATIMAIKNRKRLKALRAKGDKRTAAENAEYKQLKMSIVKGAGVGAGVGAAVGYASSRTGLNSGIKQALINQKGEKWGDKFGAARIGFTGGRKLAASARNYSAEDDAFGDFYADTADIYGDNIEEAYADFVEFTEELEDEMYSSEDEVSFEDFYTETYDIYGDNIEEAYADFVEFTETEEEETEDEYGIKDMARKVAKGFKNTLGEGGSVDGWIDRTGAKMKKAGISSPYGANHKVFSAEDEAGDLDVFSDGFATYYAENEDAYGDSEEGLEEAYDDFADLIADEELEELYSDKPSFLDRTKSALTSNTAKSVGTGAAIGTGLGLAGGLIAGSVGKEAKERKALKAKARSGRLSAAEQARYDELKAKRRKKIAIGAGAGLVAGAGAGLAAEKTGHADAIRNGASWAKQEKGVKAKGKSFLDGYKSERAIYKAERNAASNVVKKDDQKSFLGETTNDRSFSAIDLLGTPGNVTDKSFSTLEETKSGTQSMVLSILGN